MKKTAYEQVQAYITKDGSTIRELMHPAQHGDVSGVQRQSLAEASVAVGGKTRLHKHHQSEELYYIVQGEGMMTLGNEQFTVTVGDTVCISPGTVHCIENIGAEALKIICCCSPAYAHDDTELLNH